METLESSSLMKINVILHLCQILVIFVLVRSQHYLPVICNRDGLGPSSKPVDTGEKVNTTIGGGERVQQDQYVRGQNEHVVWRTYQEEWQHGNAPSLVGTGGRSEPIS